MKTKPYTPSFQDPNQIAAFVRHSSRPSGEAEQGITDVTLPHNHPDLGRVVTIGITAVKDGDGSKSNTVILHLPIKTLAEWLTQLLPDTPKVGASEVSEVDFSGLLDPEVGG